MVQMLINKSFEEKVGEGGGEGGEVEKVMMVKVMLHPPDYVVTLYDPL